MLYSELNPEAPEFYPLNEPDLKETLQEGFNFMQKAVRQSNTFPIGASYDLFQTYTDFNVVICKLRKNVEIQSSQIMAMELPKANLESNDNDSNTEKVVDATDIILDRIGVHVDNTTGAGAGDERPFTSAASGTPAAWNRAPVLTTVTVGGGRASLLGAKNIPRPQLSFKHPVDNTDKLFVPRIHDKPNSIKPLALTILYDDTGNPVGYEHPYKTELDMYSPPEWALEDGPPPEMPPPPEATPLTFVDTEAQLEELVRHLAEVSEIAVDLEHHTYRTYQGLTCLVQISTDEGGDFIVDALALRDHLHALNESFTDPAKIKVFHGANKDIVWLQRDFGVYVVGLFDTHQAARMLKFDRLGLKHLLQKYCDVHVDKAFQLADWRMRPLPAELVQYARGDTHHLLYVWRRMRRELRARAPALLRATFAKGVEIAGVTYKKPTTGEGAHAPPYLRSGKRFRRAQLAALSLTWEWRDRQAREADESPGYLLPNHMLLALVEALPRDLQGLRALAVPPPPFLNQNIDQLHRIILACREIPDEPLVLSMPPNMLAMLEPPTPDLYIGTHDFDEAPESWAVELDVTPQSSDGEAVAASDAGPAAWDNAASMPWNDAGPVTSCDMGDVAWTYEDPMPMNYAEFLSPMSADMLSPADLAAFAAHYLTPPDSPPAPAAHSLPQTSNLNAEAETFVPPYNRYKIYRVICQAEEMKAFEDKEARVETLGRDTVLGQLTPLALAEAPGPSRSASLLVALAEKLSVEARSSPTPSPLAEHTGGLCLAEGPRQTPSPPLIAEEADAAAPPPREPATARRDTKRGHELQGKQENNVKPFDYKKANYGAFHHNDDKQRKTQ